MICDLPEFYSETRVLARKPHTCCETGRTIQPGEHYWRCVGKWEGRFETHIQSESAYHFARYLNIVLHDECVAGFGAISDAISDLDCGPRSVDGLGPLERVWRQICAGERTWGPEDSVDVGEEATA